MIDKAIQFATVCHSGQTRKGTDVPYILHCLEAGTITANLTNDEEIISASILHDTIEDSYATKEMIEEIFNERVANLVSYQSEDKSKSWEERKQSAIDLLNSNIDKDVEIVYLADKLSNMRAIYRDYKKYGDELWDRFNAGKQYQEWYYNSIAEALTEIKDTDEHKEYVTLISKTFD